MSSTKSIINPSILARRALKLDPAAIQEAMTLGRDWKQRDKDRRVKPGTPNKVTRQRGQVEAGIASLKTIRAIANGRVTPVPATKSGRSDFAAWMNKNIWKDDKSEQDAVSLARESAKAALAVAKARA